MYFQARFFIAVENMMARNSSPGGFTSPGKGKEPMALKTAWQGFLVAALICNNCLGHSGAKGGKLNEYGKCSRNLVLSIKWPDSANVFTGLVATQFSSVVIHLGGYNSAVCL